jgi:glycosyltransferase involved in cell wall biosynthesis
MTTDLVSIIVPAYRHERYVLDCLQSLHAQTHERLELIFIDDCSPDRTLELTEALLATRFASRFENVVLRRKTENRGAHDSLNTGLELASGDYIAIVNSDDLFRPRRVEHLLTALNDRGSGFGFSIVEILNDDEAEDGAARDQERAAASPVPESVMLLGLRQQLAIARDVSVGFALLRQNVSVSTGNFLFSSEVARKVGRFLPLKYCHDWDFILQALVHTEPVAVLEPLYQYRVHQQNSFRGYAQRAEHERLFSHLSIIETEVVLRRFFRSVVSGRLTNRLCPSPGNWPGYFEAFIREAGYWSYWAKEAAEPLPAWRTYDKIGLDQWDVTSHEGEVRSVDTALRLLHEASSGDAGTRQGTRIHNPHEPNFFPSR